MKFDELVELFKDRPFFESGEVHLIFDESTEQIEARLSRWVHMGKLLKLRHKRYLLGKKYRHAEPSRGYISNFLYRPSYVSLRTSLRIYDMIPEAVYINESVTLRKTAEWETDIGVFKYYSIKNERFWGYRMYPERDERTLAQQKFLLALPEKVLLDLFYLMKGEWSKDRIKEMRFQNMQILKPERLKEFEKRFKSPKVTRATNNFLSLFFKEEV